MRIAFVIYGSLDQVSGGFIYDRALVDALRALGHQIDVIGLPWRGYAHALARSLFRGQRHAGVATPPRTIPAYDVVIQDELVHPSVFRQDRGFPDGPRARLRVALVHNLKSRQPVEAFRALKIRVERQYFATVDGVIAVCGQTLTDLRALTTRMLPAVIAHPGRDHVIPGVDEHQVLARSAEPGPLRILHAAAVAPHKGLHRLLAALANAANRGSGFDFTLDVVGDLSHASHARSIKRQLSRLGITSRVKLRGQLQGAQLWDVFRRCHLMALPSDREAYALASLEALGFGLPVLGTSAGGLNEMFSHGVEGYLLPPDDIDAWTEALVRLAANRAELSAMGCAALARYRGHATWREVAISVQDFLQAQLDRRELRDLGDLQPTRGVHSP